MLVNNPATQLPEILKVVKGPDFPTYGIIHGRAGILEAYKTGRGRFTMRAKAAIETMTKDKQAIIVTEIPYQVNKARLVERIADLVNDKVIDDISDIRDESDRDGMRIVVELKRGAEAQIVLNQLYKHTSMQESFSMILLAIAHGQPRELGLIPAIQYFIEHRVDVVRRRTAYLLNKAQEREHILEGYLTALDHLDNVITIIRASANRADARDNLVAYFGGKKIDINTTGRAPKLDPEKPFTTRQADAILELQLHRLTKLSIDEISNELKDVRDRITEFQSILGSEKKLRNVIVKELEEVKKQYGDERRTVIEDEAAEIMSLNAAIVLTAASFFCSRTNPEIAFRVLNRKCGSICRRNAFNCALESSSFNRAVSVSCSASRSFESSTWLTTSTNAYKRR